jgi:hypothetical protein
VDEEEEQLMDAEKLIRSALSEHAHWWAEMDRAIGSENQERMAVVACASASSVGLAVALAWVAREFPDRVDEAAALVMHYVENGGDDEELLAEFLPAVSS